MNVKLRLYGFAPAIVLLAALVGWAGHSAWRQLKQLRKNFGAVQSESFHLAEHVEASILTLSETVLRFDLRKDPADKDHFHKENEELKLWIRKSSVTTPRELEDRKSTRLNSSHDQISYAVFCLKKKKTTLTTNS